MIQFIHSGTSLFLSSFTRSSNFCSASLSKFTFVNVANSPSTTIISVDSLIRSLFPIVALARPIKAGDTITVKYYLETANIGYGSIGIMQNGNWSNDGFPNHSAEGGLTVGEWAEWTVTMTGSYDYVCFYSSGVNMTIYIESIVVGGGYVEPEIPEEPEVPDEPETPATVAPL